MIAKESASLDVMSRGRFELVWGSRTDGGCLHLGFSDRVRRPITEREQRRVVNQRQVVGQHAEGVTGNVAQTCRYFGISRQTFNVRSRR